MDRRSGGDHAPADRARLDGGRPIIVTDLRNPSRPRAFPMQPVDLFRQDGVTAYSHDVDVDDDGIAWVSGAGGTRGYHTDGKHFDPVQRRYRHATPLEPIPYGGGGIPRSVSNDDTGGFEHNAIRPVGRDAPRGDDRYRKGELLLMTEEDFGPAADGCRNQGQFSIASLKGSYNGEAWRSTPQNPFRLQIVGKWSPFGQEGSRPATGPFPPLANFCSAHYFDIQGSVLAYAWYGEGTRFIDISNPAAPAADRLLAARQRHRVGVVLLRGLRLHGRPHARRRRPEGQAGCLGRERGQGSRGARDERQAGALPDPDGVAVPGGSRHRRALPAAGLLDRVMVRRAFTPGAPSANRNRGTARMARPHATEEEGELMVHRRALSAAFFASLLLVVLPAPAVAAWPDGRHWKQVTETTGLTWNQVAAVCPRDGVNRCSGLAGGRDVNGWIWATDRQVVELMGHYAPEILTAEPAERRRRRVPVPGDDVPRGDAADVLLLGLPDDSRLRERLDRLGA